MVAPLGALAGLAGVASEDVDFLGTFDAASQLALAVRGELRRQKQGPGAALVTDSEASNCG